MTLCPVQAGNAVQDAVSEGYQKFKNGDAKVKAAVIGGIVGEAAQLFGGEFAEIAKVGKIGKISEVGKFAEGANDTRKVFIPMSESGEALKTIKSAAGNTEIGAEAHNVAHTQLRQDASGNYAQRTTFDAKGRKRSDTHFTTHNEKNKANPHKHTY